MRLVTFNILHGQSPEDGRVDIQRFAAAVQSLDADVLALQEVDRGQERSARADLTEVAAEAMNAPEYRFAAAMVGTPGSWVAASGREAPDEAAYGVALLSRYPVRSWDVVRLPPMDARTAWLGRVARLTGSVRDEPRVGLVAKIEGPGGRITTASTHLSFLDGSNVEQLRVLALTLRLSSGPIILMGDLNLPADAAQRISGMTTAVLAPTYPAHSPRRQIDHFLCHGLAGPFRGGARRMPLSDHRALVLELDLPMSSDQI